MRFKFGLAPLLGVLAALAAPAPSALAYTAFVTR